MQDKDGWTALHAAAHQGHFGCATALIDSGADRIVPDNSGQNAAMVAEGRKYNALGHLIMFGTQDARRRIAPRFLEGLEELAEDPVFSRLFEYLGVNFGEEFFTWESSWPSYSRLLRARDGTARS